MGGGGAPRWGRFDKSIGAVVDDRSKSIWNKQVGWVTPEGRVRWRGHDFAITDVPPELQPTAQQMAMKAKQLFAAPAAPVGEQMAEVQARAAAPKPGMMSTPLPGGGGPSAPHPDPAHALLAKSFTHLANKLVPDRAKGGY